MTLLLEGVLGSTAYGLAHEDSDIDLLGIFVAPTLDIAGLGWHGDKESRVRTDPDVTHHEVGKYLRLALKCNPTAMELLWLDAWTQYDITWADPLVGLREDVLSHSAVTNAYLGYARSQIGRMHRDDARGAKHARHCLRLTEQAEGLLTDGRLNLRVADPQRYWDLSEMPAQRRTQAMQDAVDRVQQIADEGHSALADRPDRDAVERVLRDIRRDYLED
jgi:predicted nucleotidyltransferase